MTRIGSLFTGYGGLDHAVQNVLGGDVAWVSDIDPGVCKILAHHWPAIPNLGDITAVDWSQVQPVDIITGGSPCQDLSHAGKRGGMRTGTRSNLWVSMREAIAQLQPRLVVWENVRGAYSAEADSEMEPCPGCVGDEPGVHLRALGRVLGDLADLRYDTKWHGLTAAGVGAPHGRFRCFLVAWPQLGHTDGFDREGRRTAGLSGEAGFASGFPADAECHGHQGLLRDAAGPAGQRRRPADPDGTDVAAHPDDVGRDGRRAGELGPGRWGQPTDGGDSHADTEVRGGPDINGCCTGLQIRAVPGAGSGDRERDPAQGVPDMGRTASVVATGDPAEPANPIQWGRFEHAIRRWESLTRPAPAPTETGPKGGQRLSPRFVEWMMGLPAGHVTDVPGLSRNDQLKALGNGVVPQQAETALRYLLNVTAAVTRD